jgi:hypothetical protein
VIAGFPLLLWAGELSPGYTGLAVPIAFLTGFSLIFSGLIPPIRQWAQENRWRYLGVVALLILIGLADAIINGPM